MQDEPEVVPAPEPYVVRNVRGVIVYVGYDLDLALQAVVEDTDEV